MANNKSDKEKAALKELLDEQELLNQSAEAEEETDEITGQENQEDDFLAVDKKPVKKSHMGRNLLAAFLVLALLITGAFFALRVKEKPQAGYPSKMLVEKAAADLISIEVDNHYKEHFVIAPTMVGNEQKWAIDKVPYNKVQQYSTDLFATRAYYLKADKVIGELDKNNLEQYGLENPVSTVTVTYFGQANARTFYLGNKYSDGGYYLYEKGVDELYIVPDYVGDDWAKSLNELRVLPSLSITADSIGAISLERKGKRTIKTAYIKGALAGTEAWYILEPVNVGTDQEKMQTYVDSYTDFRCTGYIAEKVGTDAAKYGFDSPESKIVIINKSASSAETILLGNIVPNTNGTRYIVILGKEEKLEEAVVYSVELSLQGIFNMEMLDVADSYILSANINWLQSGSFTLYDKNEQKNKTYNIKIERTAKLNDDGKPVKDSSGDIVYNSKYYINDLILDEEQFKTFYGKFVMLQIDGELPAGYQKGKEVFSYSFKVKVPITATENDTTTTTYKDVEYTASLYELDVNFLVLRTNESDAEHFMVKQRSIDALAEALKLLLEGKLPTV